jgi:hypothetical protein
VCEAVRRACVIGVLLTIVLAGCYGSTEPATNVGPESATLNGKGTANHGGVSTKFEYALTGRVGDPQQVSGGHFPAGASGPFSAKIFHLAAGSNYSFRMCGLDDGEVEYICAQTRTFTTPPAVEDSVYGGWFAGCCASFSVDARSGPSGESPHGTMAWHEGPTINDQTEMTFTSDEITCLEVDGARAAIGAVGILHIEPSGEDHLTSALATIVDGRTQVDTYHRSSPSNVSFCADASFDDQTSLGSQFEFVVNDASASSSTAAD